MESVDGDREDWKRVRGLIEIKSMDRDRESG